MFMSLFQHLNLLRDTEGRLDMGKLSLGTFRLFDPSPDKATYTLDQQEAATPLHQRAQYVYTRDNKSRFDSAY